jgi:alkyl sulfatase BDS1-like metallo-beta-lactamase superfamily hydrolase
LARCALADGDERRAHELAARALLAAPENDMARRMEARLAEVLSHRGETVSRPGATDVGAFTSRAASPPPGTAAGTRRSLLDRIRGR